MNSFLRHIQRLENKLRLNPEERTNLDIKGLLKDASMRQDQRDARKLKVSRTWH